MTKFILKIHTPKKGISATHFIALERIIKPGKDERVFQMLHVDGKDLLIDLDATKEQIEELAGVTEWQKGEDIYLSEYAASVLSSHLSK